MLNRRSFLAIAATLGITSALPERIQAGPSSCQTERIHASLHPFCDGDGTEANGVGDIERLENLLDDLDCTEVAITNTHGSVQTVSGREGLRFKLQLNCPFVNHQSVIPPLTVTSAYYWCDECQMGGTAVDLYQRIKGIPFGRAMTELGRLLESKELTGNRIEHKYQWGLWEQASNFHHDVLCSRPEAKLARVWLKEQGITNDTIDAFQIGYAPRSHTPLLADHLVSHRFRQEEPSRPSDCPNETQELIERCGRDQLWLPISDWQGRYWGCFLLPLQPHGRHRGRGTETIIDVSSRRLRRLVFSPPPYAQHNTADTILVTRDAWDVIALFNAGIHNVAYWLNGSSAGTTYALRTTLAHASTIIYPWHGDTASLETLLGLVGPAASRLRLLVLRNHDRLFELLQKEGPDAVRSAMANAIPVSKWTA